MCCFRRFHHHSLTTMQSQKNFKIRKISKRRSPEACALTSLPENRGTWSFRLLCRRRNLAERLPAAVQAWLALMVGSNLTHQATETWLAAYKTHRHWWLICHSWMDPDRGGANGKSHTDQSEKRRKTCMFNKQISWGTNNTIINTISIYRKKRTVRKKHK